MLLQWGRKSMHTSARYQYPKHIFASAKYWRMGMRSAYLRKPVTREEGGALGADFTKVYATRSSTTSSEITPENKCDQIHLLASLQWTTLFYMSRSIINCQNQSQNKFPIHPHRILTQFSTYAKGKSSTWCNMRYMLFTWQLDHRQDMHHAEPEVSLHVHFANAHLAQGLQFEKAAAHLHFYLADPSP